MDFVDFPTRNLQWTLKISQIYVPNFYKIDIHATNVAIQKTAPNYDQGNGCKWLLRNLRLFLLTKHSENEVGKLFTEIEAMVVRSLMSVQKIMINNKHCFELYN